MRRWWLAAMPLIVALALSACNSTESVLDQSVGPQSSAAAGTQPVEASQEIAAGDAGEPAGAVAPATVQPALTSPGSGAATLNAQAAALSSNARVQLAPIVGSTVEAVTPLTRRLSQRAAQRGIALVSSGAAYTTHLMKGYFSAITDGGETTVIYVWDVLDPAGNRLHRIQGQEKTEKVTADGWPGVPGPTMEVIGDNTIDQLAAWLAARPG